eukprot:3190903-Prymnesium_polylepis.1
MGFASLVTVARGSFADTDGIFSGEQDTKARVYLCDACSGGSCTKQCESGWVNDDNDPKWNLLCNIASTSRSESVYIQVEEDDGWWDQHTLGQTER